MLVSTLLLACSPAPDLRRASMEAIPAATTAPATVAPAALLPGPRPPAGSPPADTGSARLDTGAGAKVPAADTTAGADTAPAADTGQGVPADTGAEPEPAAPVEDTAPATDTAAPPAPPAPAEDTSPPVDTAAPPPPPAPEPAVEDTGAVDTGAAVDTGDAGLRAGLPPLVARLEVDVDEGEFPLTVTFDASGSDLGSGTVRYEWSFGDGFVADGDAVRAHTYVGEGEFEVVLTIVDETTGAVSSDDVEIEVDTPDCPREAAPVAWGFLDSDLDGLSGIAASKREADLYWTEEDNDDDLVVVDGTGNTVSEHDMPNDYEQFEDIEVAVDPATGTSYLFVADIGDNDLSRDEIAVYVVEEPDPWVDGDIEPLRVALTYPDGAHDAETLLVDPFTLDIYVVTKSNTGDQGVYAKRAPHDGEGPYELENLGTYSSLDMSATGGDVSADGFRIVIRDYTTEARVWFRDGYEPFEAAFDEEPCEVEIFNDTQGEAVTFTLDGGGIVTASEGGGVPLFYVAF